MKTQKEAGRAPEPDNIIDATERLRPTPVTPLSKEEELVIDAFIRHKRIEARAKARAKALQPTIFAILKGRQAVKRRGARVGLKNNYDYTYSAAIVLLEESLEVARTLERQQGLAKAAVTESIAFEDIDAKALKKKTAAAAGD